MPIESPPTTTSGPTSMKLPTSSLIGVSANTHDVHLGLSWLPGTASTPSGASRTDSARNTGRWKSRGQSYTLPPT
nr:hypothetical protein [Polymorphobacter multimanifer]